MIYLKKELIKANIKTLYKFLLTTGFKEEDVVKILTDKEAILRLRLSVSCFARSAINSGRYSLIGQSILSPRKYLNRIGVFLRKTPDFCSQPQCKVFRNRGKYV